MARFTLVTLATAALFAGTAHARPDFIFDINLDGAQEVNGGDPDGTGTAHLVIDTDQQPPTIDWSIIVNNISLPATGAHIHNAPAGSNGPIVVDFNAQFNGTGLADLDLNNVVANPANFYVNIHNADFPGGAIRGQLPAPGALGLLALGALVGARRRRA